jgi:hypothetical protein
MRLAFSTAYLSAKAQPGLNVAICCTSLPANQMWLHTAMWHSLTAARGCAVSYLGVYSPSTAPKNHDPACNLHLAQSGLLHLSVLRFLACLTSALLTIIANNDLLIRRIRCSES